MGLIVDLIFQRSAFPCIHKLVVEIHQGTERMGRLNAVVVQSSHPPTTCECTFAFPLFDFNFPLSAFCFSIDEFRIRSCWTLWEPI